MSRRYGRVVAAIGGLIALFAAAAALSQPSKKADLAAREQQQPDAKYQPAPLVIQVVPALKTEAEARAEKRENERKADVDAKALTTNVFLAIFAFGQLVVTGITLFGLKHAKTSAEAADNAANAAKASIDHLKLIERAYVFGGIMNVKADPKTGATSFDLVIHNAGRTPARVREVHVGVAPHLTLSPGKWPDVPDYSATTAYSTDTIFEGGVQSPQIDFHDMVTVGVVYGYVLYDDVFQRSHFSRFCMAYSGVEGRASTFGNEAWNKYD